MKEAIEAGAAGADVDVKEMLGALKNAAAGEHVGENLEYVAEFCEVRYLSVLNVVSQNGMNKIDPTVSIIKIVDDRDSNTLLHRHIHGK